ncbi:hypothetical protein Droror1_Dr00025805, partial [Drosera rotundifolia]
MPSSYRPRENPVWNPVFLSGFLSKSKNSWIPWWVFDLIECEQYAVAVEEIVVLVVKGESDFE